ncbi:hypothetical protein ACLOJK_029466, partial [Asimina triloba]
MDTVDGRHSYASDNRQFLARKFPPETLPPTPPFPRIMHQQPQKNPWPLLKPENYRSDTVGNPRNLGFLPTPAIKQPVPPDLAEKPPPPILDRFRALLKLREDEDGGSPVTAEEIVRMYEEVLSELTFNSKPIITDLTIIAGDQKEHGEAIANAICGRILEVPVEQKLPSLYLLDSIVKNIGGYYVEYFAAWLPEMQEADPTRNTATSNIGGEGMEGATLVNPKGLSGASSKFHDNQLGRGFSSSGQIYGQKPSTGPFKYIFDHVEGVASPSGDGRKGLQSEWLLAASKNKLSSPLSPSRVVAAGCLSPRGNQFARDIPHARGLEGASRSPSVLTSEIRGGRGGKWHYQWEKFWPDDDTHELESSTCSNSNVCNLQQPREVSKSASHDKHMVVNQPDANSIDNKLTVAQWQNIEEDEYDWEDMSPALADHNRGDDLRSFDFHIGNLNTACSSERLNAAPEPALQRSKWASHVQQSVVDEFTINVEDKISVQNSVHIPMIDKSPSGTGIQHKSFTQFPHSHYSWEPQHLLHDFQPREVDSQSPLSVNRIALSSEQRMPSTRIKSSSFQPPNVDIPLHMTSTSNLEKHMLLKQHSPPEAPTSCTPPPKYHQPSFLPRIFQHKQMNGQFNFKDGDADGKMLNFTEHQAPNQLDNLISLNWPPIFEPHEIQGTLSETAAVQRPPHLLSWSFNNVLSEGQDAVWNANLPSPLPVASSASVMIPCFPNASFQVQRFDLPPLTPGRPPTSSQVGQSSQTACSVFPHPLPGGTFSGLISSLMAKGLISLPQPTTSQDFLGLEFDAEVLKLRHESVINALYVDLPRQCTTCGLRFKFQGEHSRHMDWHVTKNRMSKNRKQNPSRKWFVSAKEWFSGAETLGTDATPGFLPTEAIVEKREDEEMAVPADDNQSVCALCGDPFEDFYSDETEEWMYRGAVYLNAPDGSIESSSRSQLGPIVHAKCRSESMEVPQDFPQDKGRNDEEKSLTEYTVVLLLPCGHPGTWTDMQITVASIKTELWDSLPEVLQHAGILLDKHSTETRLNIREAGGGEGSVNGEHASETRPKSREDREHSTETCPKIREEEGIIQLRPGPDQERH